MPAIDPVADRGEVGGRVKERTVPLANDHGGLESLQENAHRPVALPRQSQRFKLRHHLGQLIVVEALAKFLVEGDVESRIDAVNFLSAER
jgi:hypothetical protein